MRVALIGKTSGLVENIIVVSELSEGPEDFTCVESEAASIGDTYASKKFTKPSEVHAETQTTSLEVNRERDRRISAGFMFNGKQYDCRPDDQINISGAAQMAFMAIVAGAPSGFLRWHQGSTDFGWIAQDNTITLMDAQTVVAFGQAAAAWKQAHMFAGRAVKDVEPVPQDYVNNSWWPVV